MTNSRNDFLIFWCDDGIEHLVNLTHHRADVVQAQLEEIPPPAIPDLVYYVMRARLNSHRNYECYGFTAEPDILEQGIREAFGNNPDHMKKWIRDNGINMFTR